MSTANPTGKEMPAQYRVEKRDIMPFLGRADSMLFGLPGRCCLAGAACPEACMPGRLAS